MCGIVGFSGARNDRLLNSMRKTILHRGPDDYGTYSDGQMNLAMNRLSIVDIEGGKQPLSNEDGTIWVVFNGEIYNHLELRNELLSKGHRFKTDHSDTEVIVHLYEDWGPKWPLKVNGMFGVAIWDLRLRRLLLFRDRIGKKPLYYAAKGNSIIFGSEIKAVCEHPLVSQELDYGALFQYFGLKHISAPRTAFTDVKQLLPGFMLTWQSDGIKTEPYWQLDFGSPLEEIPEEEAADHLLELLEDAVKLRMQCDAPFGAYLSGGVDSSSVVALMSRQSSRPIKTFCLGYEDLPRGQFDGKAQDMIFARNMSQILGTEHHEYIISAGQFADQMAEILRSFDEPFSGVVSTFFLSILISKHVKVALSGDGADELFGSYLAHRLAFPIEHYVTFVSKGKRERQDLNQEELDLLRPFDGPAEFPFLQNIASIDLSEWRGKLNVFNNQERSQLLSEDFLTASGYPSITDSYGVLEPQLTARDALNRSLEIDQKELLPNQVLPFVDRLSMAHSIEVRVPYLDYRILEFANRLPGRLKIQNGVNKYIHKKAMEKILPEELVQRPKEGFVQPIYSWMHGPLKGWVLKRMDALPREFFNTEYIQDLKAGFDKGQQGLNAKIWNLLCFGMWFEGIHDR